MKKALIFIAVALGFTLLFCVAGEVMAQCPMCKAAVETGKADGPSPMAEGLNNGILYLFVLPYLMVGLIGFLLYRGYKARKNAQQEAQV